MYETNAGVLLARRAVRAVVEEAVRSGVEYSLDAALPSSGSERRLSQGVFYRRTCSLLLRPRPRRDLPGAPGRPHSSDASGSIFLRDPGWRPRFRPASHAGFGPHHRRAWPYTIPDLENRGFKLAFDRHGPEFDPDSGDRVALGVDGARAFLAERFPALATAPLLESRVCQYENTSTGDFLIDRHPDFDNVWLVGGGSGHGFKHGPAVAEHACALIEGRAPVEPRFGAPKQSPGSICDTSFKRLLRYDEAGAPYQGGRHYHSR